MNLVILKGNLTRDTNLSYTPSQTAIAEFGLAVTERRKQGEDWTDVPHFFDCQMYGKRAETVNKYFKKGDPILLKGRLSYQTWEKDGKKHSRVRVVVDDFEFVGKNTEQSAPPPADAGEEIPF